jgi:hypothetical protein
MLLAPLGMVAALLVAAEPDKDASLEAVIDRPEPLQFELGARLEFRAGQPEGSAPGSAITDLEIDPLAALRIPLRTGSLSLAYEPRVFITLKEPIGQPAQDVSYLHRGRLVFDVKPTPLWRFFIEGRGAYGEYDFLPLSTVIPQSGGSGLPPAQPSTPGAPPTAPTPDPGVSTLPGERFLRVIDLHATTGVVASLSPRVSWLFSAGYDYSGGADTEARTQLPLQKGPHGLTGAIWSVTRNDSLAFLLEGSHSRFSSGPQATVGTLTSTWSHVWSRTVATDLIGGIGGFHADVPAVQTSPARTEDKLLPVGGLGLRHAWLTRWASWKNSLTFLAAPLPDQINGLVYERLSAVLRSTLAPGERLLLDVSGGASASIGAPQRDARIEAKGTYLFGPQVGISVGGRVAWLEGSALLPTGFGWLCLVSIGTYAGSPVLGAPM